MTTPCGLAAPVARSEEHEARSKEQGARMIFGTKLDEVVTRSKAGRGT